LTSPDAPIASRFLRFGAIDTRQTQQANSCICDNPAMTNTEEDDEALIGRYARGDTAAFDQLYRRHELRVWRYLERNVCNQATSDDLLQEIWFALARNAASLESVT
jgi:RNA polymerase sigma-70 factor (ECF subfamily)